MSKIHDPDMFDSEKPLYVFEQKVICDRLINALESFYGEISKEINPVYIIQLVPSDIYFLSYRDVGWSYSEKIYITKEQVDKYLILFDSFEMPFLEYMEILHEG